MLVRLLMSDQDYMCDRGGETWLPPLSVRVMSSVARYRGTVVAEGAAGRGSVKARLVALLDGMSVFMAGILLTGCHTYVPIALHDAPLESEVRATLTTEARVGLEDRLGLGRASLTGRLLERHVDSLTLLVRTAGVGSGATHRPLGIAQQDIITFELKENHDTRTLGLILGVVGGVTLVSILLMGEVDTGNPLPSPPDPPERVMGWPDWSPPEMP